MKEERYVIAQPVKSLQEMLRLISFEDQDIPHLVPDGVFGEQTLEAVMVFQRDNLLPVTGIVDQRTWDAIAENAARVEKRLQPPEPVSGLPDRNSSFQEGDQQLGLYLPQAVFLALSQLFQGIEAEPVSGRYTPETRRNTLWIQKRARLPENGIFDKEVWNALARLYQIFVVRCPAGRQGMDSQALVRRDEEDGKM